MRNKITGKVNIKSLRPSLLLLLFFFLSYLTVIISACNSPASTSTPAPEMEKPSSVTVVEETSEETLPTDNVEDGRALFISKACTGCHVIKGIPEAQGKVGPELTHQASNAQIIGVVANSEENLRKYLKDPAKLKPGISMPNQHLTDSEIDALLVFLRTLK